MTLKEWKSLWIDQFIKKGVGYLQACIAFDAIYERRAIDLTSCPIDAAKLILLTRFSIQTKKVADHD